MSIQSLLDWLSSPAAPGWIFGALMFVIALLQWLRGRKRPSLVVVRQILATSLVSAPKDVPRRVTINYGDRRVGMVWVTDLRVRNTGQDVIPRPVLYLEVDDGTTILDNDLDDLPPGEQITSSLEGMGAGNRVIVEFPYLNPFDQYKQEPLVKLLCDREPERLTVKGGGEGWALEYYSLGTRRESLLRRLVLARRVGMVTTLVVLLIGVPFLRAQGAHPFLGYILVPLLVLLSTVYVLTIYWETQLKFLS